MIPQITSAPIPLPSFELQDTNYWRLLRNLPENEKQCINTTHITGKKLDKFFEDLDLEATPHTEESLRKLSLYSLVAFREKRITFEETVSHHLFISTVYELFITEKNPVQTVEKVFYSSKKDDLILHCFDLLDGEHERFEQMMRQTSLESEKYAYLINLPPNYSSEFFELVSGHISILKVRDGKFLIPSFTMLKTLFSLLSLRNGPCVTLVPVFGQLSADEVESMKAVRQTPLGLYCPENLSANRRRQSNWQFMKITDGYNNVGTFQFWVHDIYHALREMAQKDPYAYARSRLASLLKVHPRHDYLTTNIQQFLDGEINSTSEPGKLYHFPKVPFAGILEPYKNIPDYHVWNDYVHDTFMEDFVSNQADWRRNFQVTTKDLSSDQKHHYRKVKQTKLVSKIARKKLTKTIKLAHAGVRFKARQR